MTEDSVVPVWEAASRKGRRGDPLEEHANAPPETSTSRSEKDVATHGVPEVLRVVGSAARRCARSLVSRVKVLL